MLYIYWLLFGLCFFGLFIGVGIGSLKRLQLQKPETRIRWFVSLCLTVFVIMVGSVLVWGSAGGIMGPPLLFAIMGFLMGAGSLPKAS